MNNKTDANRQFLLSTDYKVQRYFEQKALNLNPASIDDLLTKREEARQLAFSDEEIMSQIIKPESDISEEKTSEVVEEIL